MKRRNGGFCCVTTRKLCVAIVFPPDHPHVGEDTKSAEDVTQYVFGGWLWVADKENSAVKVRTEGVTSLSGGEGSNGRQGAYR